MTTTMNAKTYHAWGTDDFGGENVRDWFDDASVFDREYPSIEDAQKDLLGAYKGPDVNGDEPTVDVRDDRGVPVLLVIGRYR